MLDIAAEVLAVYADLEAFVDATSFVVGVGEDKCA